MQPDIDERGVVLAVLLDFLLEIVGLGRQALDDFLLIGDQAGGALAKRLRHRRERQGDAEHDEREDQERSEEDAEA